MTAMLMLWVFMGLFAGYSSSRLYKMFKGLEWRKIALSTAFLFLGMIFAIFFILNTLVWGEKSFGAMPFTTLFVLVMLWFGISVPLVFVGSYIGFKKLAIKVPVKTNKISRQILEQVRYMNPALSVIVGGVLPFACLHRALLHPHLHMAVPVLLYIRLPLPRVHHPHSHLHGDHDYSVVLPAMQRGLVVVVEVVSDIRLFGPVSLPSYGVQHLPQAWITKPISGILYFGCTLIASYAFFVLTNTIGFYACFWFTSLIYSVKID